jgi:hypothetical protein
MYYEASFNLFSQLSQLFGKSTTILLCVTSILISLYLLFKISYKKIIKKVVSFTPDMESIKDGLSNLKSAKYDEEEEIPKKRKISKPKSVDKEIEKERMALEKMKREFEKEKEQHQKKKDKQLNLDDAPIKISIEKKQSV